MQEVSFILSSYLFVVERQPEWYQALFPASLVDTQGTIFKSSVCFSVVETRGVQFCHQSYLIAYVINVILLLKIPKSIQWLAQDN